jgi:predicted kinase
MIIIVCGLPGSGKSMFAERLAERVGGLYINSDQVRLQLHASGKYSAEDKLVVYKEMLFQTTNALEENRDVIVDGTFYHHSLREMFLRLADAYHTVLEVIEIIADELLIAERLRKPRKYSEADFTVYEKVRDDFEGITMPHLTLESTNDNLDVMLKSAINYIERDRH